MHMSCKVLYEIYILFSQIFVKCDMNKHPSNLPIYPSIFPFIIIQYLSNIYQEGYTNVLHKKLPKDSSVLYVPHGKRKPGRPRTLYLKYVQDLLGDSEGMLQPNNISSLAQDRSGWRNLVVACSAAEWWWWCWLLYPWNTTCYYVFIKTAYLFVLNLPICPVCYWFKNHRPNQPLSYMWPITSNRGKCCLRQITNILLKEQLRPALMKTRNNLQCRSVSFYLNCMESIWPTEPLFFMHSIK